MIFITGSTGFLGKTLIHYIKGYELKCLVRKNSDVSNLKGRNIHLALGDLNDPDSIRKAMKGCDLVVHLAAGTHTTIQEKRYENTKTNEAAMHNLIKACKINDIKKIIYVSSNAASMDIDSWYATSKRNAETILKSSGLDYVILRPTSIYGSGSKDFLKLLRMVKRGFVPLANNGNTVIQPVFVDDVAKSIVACIEDKKTRNRTYTLAGKIMTQKEFFDTIARVFNYKINYINIPCGIIDFLLRGFSFIPGVKEAYQRFSIVMYGKSSKSDMVKLKITSTGLEEGLAKVKEDIKSSCP